MSVELNSLRHLAIIPDGNGRWAQKHGLPIERGHARGAEVIKQLVGKAAGYGIDVFSIFGFSTENWTRSEEEIQGLMAVLDRLLDSEGEILVDQNIQVRRVGRRDRLPPTIIDKISALEEKTAGNTGTTVVLALDYGGRDEIVRAVNRVTSPVDEDSFGKLLDTAGLPDPDLIIRTAGEMRTSGMYPYQGTYAEFISSPVLFPDFDKEELDRCLEEFSRRQRRFGARLLTELPPSLSWLGGETPRDFVDFVGKLLPHLDQAKDVLVNRWRQNKLYDSPQLQHDIDIYQRLISKGKRLRAALVVLGFEGYHGEEQYRDGAMQAAIGYELLHNSFLIHDDIEDNAALRRGEPSVHEQYTAEGENGIALALNTGSLGPLRTQEILWDIENKSDRIIQAQKWMRYVVEATLVGQRRDLTTVSLSDLSERDVYQIYHQKTAIYSVMGPLTLGAILAGAGKKDQSGIIPFGVNLGIAFQMVDDHLGLFGNEEVLGKPVGSDLAEAKKTLHFARAYQMADSLQRRLLEDTWGKKDPSPEDIEMVRSLVDDLGVKAAVLDRADRLATKAKVFIPQVTGDVLVGNLLRELSDFVVQRNY